jgi:hypothetical protein
MPDRNDDVAAPPGTAESPLAACPHLASVDGPWHSSSPSRAHRCALLHAGRPTLERQRLHCLGSAHVRCPTWLDAHGEGGPTVGFGPFVATAPVVLEGPGLGLPAQGAARRLAAPLTVIIVGVALAALVLARGPLAPGTSGAGDDGSSTSPAASLRASQTPSASTPSSAPTATPSPRPTATSAPKPTSRPRTYKVRRGDSLSSIAAKFGTTAKKLAVLNGIKNASLIRVGQVLKLP